MFWGTSKGDYCPLVLGLSKGGSWCDKLTTNGAHGTRIHPLDSELPTQSLSWKDGGGKPQLCDLEDRVGDRRTSRGLNVDVVPFAPSDDRLANWRLVRDLAFQGLGFGGAHDGVLVLPT